jgi:hypothetical protein
MKYCKYCKNEHFDQSFLDEDYKEIDKCYGCRKYVDFPKVMDKFKVNLVFDTEFAELTKEYLETVAFVTSAFPKSDLISNRSI